MPRAAFITFEGSEGCGKSTQVRRLTARLEGLGLPLLVTREPGGTAIGETVRDLLQFAPEGEQMTPETELLLFAASRAQLVRERIAPALAAGVTVISDRFADSTTVYQGVARRLDATAVAEMNRFAVGECWPDVTFVLDLDVPSALERLAQRGRNPTRPDRMEAQPAAFYEHVRQGYLQLAAREPTRVCLVDATRSVEAIEQEIWSVIGARFPALAKAADIATLAQN